MFNEILFNSLINGYDNHLMSKATTAVGRAKTIYILNLRRVASLLSSSHILRRPLPSLLRRAKYVRLRRIHFNLIKF